MDDACVSPGSESSRWNFSSNRCGGTYGSSIVAQQFDYLMRVMFSNRRSISISPCRINFKEMPNSINSPSRRLCTSSESRRITRRLARLIVFGNKLRSGVSERQSKYRLRSRRSSSVHLSSLPEGLADTPSTQRRAITSIDTSKATTSKSILRIRRLFAHYLRCSANRTHWLGVPSNTWPKNRLSAAGCS